MTTTQPPLRIAVVVPVRNRADPLLRALRSIAGQTRRADEIIVVDDGSTPPLQLTEDAVAQGVRLIRLETGKGAGNARNIGLANAQSDLIAFLDSDDEHLEDHLATLERAFLARPDAAFVSTRTLISNNCLQPYQLAGTARTELTHQLLLEQGNLIGSCSAIAVPRDRFLAAGGMPSIAFAEDWTLLLTLTHQASGTNVNHATVLYRSPLLSGLPNISTRFGASLRSFQYIFHHFDFKISPAAARYRREMMAFLFALNGRRWRALLILLGDMRPSNARGLRLRVLIIAVLGRRTYFQILRLKARTGSHLARFRRRRPVLAARTIAR